MPDLDKLTQKNEQLQLAVNELSVLNDIATAISSTQPLNEVVDQIVLKCIKHMNTEEGAISLLDRHERFGASGSGDDDRQFHTLIRKQDLTSERVPIKLDSHITGWMLKHKEPLLSNDIQNDERFSIFKGKDEIFKSILCVPLMIKGDLIGYLAVFNKKGGKSFTEEDRRLLSIIGSQSAQVIENARLYEEEKALISLQEEMRLAKDIQLKLLPEKDPVIEGYELCGTNIPAKEVGGDYYDFIELSENRWGFCVGDITGKGMPAAMLMSNLQATLRSQAMVYKECCNCLKSVNKLLYRSTDPQKFATLVFGILDTGDHKIEYSNGGHNHPIYVSREGDITQLESTGMLLGVLEDTEFQDATLSMEPGDMLVLYSDGITEAMNKDDEEYGLDRLNDLVLANRDLPSSRLRDAIINNVRQHAGETSQSDDITLLIIKRA